LDFFFLSLQDFASLEVQVYDQKTGNIYVHHDIPLPAFPLCVAHGQVTAGGVVGNFCAVGTFEPGIEIWNLDVINALEPSCILGGDDTSAADEWMRQQMMNSSGSHIGAGGAQNGACSRRSETTGLRPGSHTDAVMALSWNTIHGQVIASGSADKTVKLWDVTQAGIDYSGKCSATTFTHHRDKVSTVVWHPREGTLLATGSHDRTVALLDARTNGEKVRSVKLPADCEVVAWDPFHAELLTVASEDGTISCWDVRKFETTTPLWTVLASEFGGVSDLAYNAHVPGLMATCSVDKRVTLWDSHHADGGAFSNTPPRPCGSKDMCAGKLYTVKFYPSEPWLLACGGTGNQLSIWHIDSEEAVLRRFGDRVSQQADENAAGKQAGHGAESADESKKEDFEAMMASKKELKPSTSKGQDESTKTSKGKKNKNKKEKRKAHRRGG
jgi:periodic tryptophan protein 1